ncbi:hypothetical protein [Campylobacter insulaenigrae]|uniref:Uncharacterized protein n=1 Tax=Campylobacter insulaenigrae NCTC 12927 TaxID=1031564 RepID=A0A0A8H197_9BACT|nr:hypothetical protein [Campylobacter insulaenigrae]AJC87821.1 hypothetical protein CINS_0857 [Campylobacter insulaenigrae NCTC 12927]VEH94190.1 Uncharacterised protein [Campylobacter insulaenigrae]
MFKNEEYIKQRKALWIKSFEAFKDDEEINKEQLELAEAGINDGFEEDQLYELSQNCKNKTK